MPLHVRSAVGVRLRQGEAAQEAQARALLVQHADREPGQGHGLPAGHRPAGRAPEGEDLPQRAGARSRGRRSARGTATTTCASAIRAPNGRKDTRHVALRRRNGRFFVLPNVRPALDRARSSSTSRSAGRSSAGARASRCESASSSTERARRRDRGQRRAASVVRRIKATSYPRGKSRVKIRLGRKAKRGAYRVTLKANAPGHASRADAARALPVASRDR